MVVPVGLEEATIASMVVPRCLAETQFVTSDRHHQLSFRCLKERRTSSLFGYNQRMSARDAAARVEGAGRDERAGVYERGVTASRARRRGRTTEADPRRARKV